MKKVIGVFLFLFIFSASVKAESSENNNVLLFGDCDEFAALVFTGGLQAGWSPERAFEVALWAYNDCETTW